MNITKLYEKALNKLDLTIAEGLFLYTRAPTSELMLIANQIKTSFKTETDKHKVGWIIDRNVNTTNVCFVQCKFCNFCRNTQSPESYITTIDEYATKIDELFKIGGDQLLLQGGMNPKLDLNFYKQLFRELKKRYPQLKLHALGPPEIVYLSNKSGYSYRKTLEILIESGLDSLPGAGAEILTNRVRQIVSKNKCTVEQWIDVMREAHQLHLPTSATMMFGHIETKQERIEHLIQLRNLQKEKPDTCEGFITFIPWPLQAKGTKIAQEYKIEKINSEDYIRLLAVSRIILNNIKNIQASWLTVGKKVAQICLFAGANDFGSIMIEENVVSSAGANNSFDANGIQQAIKETGLIPVKRNQKYEYII